VGDLGFAAELGFRLIGAAGKAFMYSLVACVDGEIENREIAHEIRRTGRRIIYAFWHGRIIAPIFSHRDRGVAILVSQSRDGEYVARIAKALGFYVVRGSSTRGGEEGFRLLVDAIRDGHDVAVTPDGPVGPKYEVKRGIVYLARASGAAILPIGIAIDRAKQFKSWDEFRLMLPGAYVLASYGEPVIVPERSNKFRMEEIRQELEVSLNALNRDVESRVLQARRTKRDRQRSRRE